MLEGALGETDVLTILLFYIPFLIFILYGQRIQYHMALIEVGGFLSQLERMKNIARLETVNAFKRFAKDEKKVEPALNVLVDSFMILPESMDPFGIVKKVEHVVNVRDDKLFNDVRRLVRDDVDDSQVRNLENMLEATIALETIYKIIRHYYLLARKMGSFMIVVQLQMLTPLVFNEAKAYLSAVFAFKLGVPIGDGIGPLVINRLLTGNEAMRVIAKDTVVYETAIEGRKAYLVKAKGPGGNVGKPGDAISKILESDDKVKVVIMVDAALKLEGERSGSVADGVGAAIGGIGVEKFKIEEIATKKRVPVYAVVIKQSLLEAISAMRKEVADAVEEVHKRIMRIIRTTTSEGDSVVIAGIGNTIGIP